MIRLARPIEQLKSHYPIVVVGSGYGGAIAASRFSRAGQEVCVLERGRERVPGEYPTTFLECAEEVHVDFAQRSIGSPTALFDVRLGKDIDVVVGCGLGGTSLINANVSLRANPRVFDDRWPKAIREDQAGILEGYARAEAMLGANPLPKDWPTLEKHEALKKCAAALGREFYAPPINVAFADGTNLAGMEEKKCLNCGECITGCNVGAKRTVLMNYLPDAVRHGAEIYCEVRVSHVSRDAGDGGKWVVHLEPMDVGRARYDAPATFVTADMVILAGGALGSTEILHRSRANGLSISDRIGERFSGNGDVLGFAYDGRERIEGVAGAGHVVGPTITGIIDGRGTPTLSDGVVIEDAAIPTALAHVAPAMLVAASAANGTNTAPGERLQQDARAMESVLLGPYHGASMNTETFLVMCHDDGKGKIDFEGDRVTVRWPSVGEQPCFTRVDRDLVTATGALGGIYTRDPIWADWGLRNLVTVHPLGGCPMADDADRGVVNDVGRVYAEKTGVSLHPDLYVIDGSILASPLGVNPLLTISAIAERACVHIAEAHGWTIDFSPKGPWARPPPEDARPVGLRFTERMAGTWATKTGVAGPFSFVLTIASEDLDAMLTRFVTPEGVNSASHAARLVGTVEAPGLSPKPLEARGEFHLFVDDPTHVDQKRMTYALHLTSEEGKRWFAFGYKIVRDRSITHGWHDATTLYLTVYEGDDDTGAVMGEGELRISFADALRLARTIDVVRAKSVVERLSSIARFGAFFFGTLWDHYGGVFGRSTAFDAKAPPRKKRPLRAPAPEPIALATDDGVSLHLARIRGGDEGPVLLVHDLGVSSRIFTLDTIDTCLVEYLVAKKFDVFLLDARTSIDVGKRGTLLDVARHDLPAAIACIAKTTGKQASIVAQGWGALATHAAMIEGACKGGVRSIVALQAGLHVEAGEAATIEAGLHVPDVLAALGVEALSVDARDDEPWWKKLYDDALRVLPEPTDERCESEVCRRIQFVYGLPFVHARLDEATHSALHELYGAAPISALEDFASMVRRGHVEDLGSAWWPFWRPRRRVNLSRLALPITYLHGADNRVNLPHATEATMAMLAKANGSKLYAREVIEGYGHLDPLIGRDAAREVYPKIVAALER